jgi:hypothetical protein
MSDSIEDSDAGRAEGRIKRADIQGQYESEPSLIKSFQSHAVSCDDASGVKLAVPRNFATTSWRKHGGHANEMTQMAMMEENDIFLTIFVFWFFLSQCMHPILSNLQVQCSSYLLRFCSQDHHHQASSRETHRIEASHLIDSETENILKAKNTALMLDQKQ